MPALLLTMSLELMGGVVIDQLHTVRVRYTDAGLILPSPVGDQGIHADRELHARHLRPVW